MSQHARSQSVVFLLLSASLALTGCQAFQPAAVHEDDPLNELQALMIGRFSSAEQAAADRDFRTVVLNIAQLWPQRTDGPWLYVEQAMAGELDKPYRQRVYRLSRMPDGTLTSAVFTLPGDPKQYVYAPFQSPGVGDRRVIAAGPLRDLTPEQLTEKAGCTVFLARTAGGFSGGTRGAGCASDLRGASYATSDVVIYEDRMETWDRGFDVGDKQVWGAVKGPYVFRRVAE